MAYENAICYLFTGNLILNKTKIVRQVLVVKSSLCYPKLVFVTCIWHFKMGSFLNVN